jgi:hypothetical protein
MAFWGALFRAMADTRTRRIRRQEAEELLSGSRTAADRDALVRLLDLAAAPAKPAELAGREVAVRALVQTYRDAARATRPRRRSPLSLLSKALAVKTIAGLAVLLLGGAAVAATTGSLPTPVQQGAHDLLSPLGVAVPAGKAPHPTGTSGGTVHPSPTPSPLTPRPGPDPDPSAGPAMAGLCQAWQAQQKGGPGKPTDSPAFQALVTAAGGPDKVAAYCAAVLGGAHQSASATPKGKDHKPSPTRKKIQAPAAPSHPDKTRGQPVASRYP